MERIAVTGGHGMLGRHVVAALEPDYDVTVVDRVDGGSHQPHGPVDVMDIEALERAVRGHDAIIHLAALDAAVDAQAHQFFHVNTLAAWNTLHVGYEAGIRKFVVCSSSSVYGVRETAPIYLPIDESHSTRATEPYGLGKRATELVADAFARRDDVVAVALRPCYVAYSHLIDRMAREVETVEPGQEPLPPLRWHVSPRDAARCFRAALEADLSSYRAFNVGGRTASRRDRASPSWNRRTEPCPRFAIPRVSKPTRAHRCSTAPGRAKCLAGRHATTGHRRPRGTRIELEGPGRGSSSLTSRRDCE